MSRLIAELDAAFAQRARLVADGREILHFGSNGCLGLAADLCVIAAPRGCGGGTVSVPRMLPSLPIREHFSRR
ncbi:MAG TPA: hypothetical protein VGK37_15030 [Casimicrobiaceae bacterium]|jgi:hypothetical protein